jgi:hypothetical protein
MFVQNWKKLDVPVKATYRGQSGHIIANRAEGTRVLFRPSDPNQQNMDVSADNVQIR